MKQGDTPAARRPWRVIVLVVVSMLIAALGYGVYLIRRTSMHLMEAEDRLQISLLVTDAIIEHTRASPTHAWPTSWDDLLRQPRGQDLLKYPGGLEYARSLVRVDFSTTVEQVLRQTPETSTAITVTPGPNYTGVPARWMYGLFDELNQQREKKTD